MLLKCYFYVLLNNKLLRDLSGFLVLFFLFSFLRQFLFAVVLCLHAVDVVCLSVCLSVSAGADN